MALRKLIFKLYTTGFLSVFISDLFREQMSDSPGDGVFKSGKWLQSSGAKGRRLAPDATPTAPILHFGESKHLPFLIFGSRWKSNARLKRVRTESGSDRLIKFRGIVRVPSLPLRVLTRVFDTLSCVLVSNYLN